MKCVGRERMELKNKKLIGAAVLGIVIVLVAFSAGYSMNLTNRDVSLIVDVGTYSAHINIYLQRAGSDEVICIKDGVALDNAGQITNIGKDFIEGKISDSAYGNNTKFADDISLSADAGAPAIGWTEIPAEIAADGLDRSHATYASTGLGVWTVSHQFTASAQIVDVQLTGLQWDPTDESNNDLLAADTFTAVTLENGDKLTVTWTVTVT